MKTSLRNSQKLNLLSNHHSMNTRCMCSSPSGRRLTPQPDLDFDSRAKPVDDLHKPTALQAGACLRPGFVRLFFGLPVHKLVSLETSLAARDSTFLRWAGLLPPLPHRGTSGAAAWCATGGVASGRAPLRLASPSGFQKGITGQTPGFPPLPPSLETRSDGGSPHPHSFRRCALYKGPGPA